MKNIYIIAASAEPRGGDEIAGRCDAAGWIWRVVLAAAEDRFSAILSVLGGGGLVVPAAAAVERRRQQ